MGSDDSRLDADPEGDIGGGGGWLEGEDGEVETGFASRRTGLSSDLRDIFQE
jgi:hypothetical protein